MAERRCIRCGLRVGMVGAVVDTLLIGIKLFVGLETGSRALMADALYSAIDLISALMVIASFKISRKGADDDHAYGHGKVEFLAIAAVSVCVLGFAVLILHGAIDDLLTREHRSVHPLAATVPAIGVIACFLVYRYARCAGQRLGSPVISSHAEHNKADAISSLAVLLTIVLSWVGLGVLDPIVAVAEVGHIIYVSVTLFRRGFDGLLDAATDPVAQGHVARAARRVPGVLGVERVRTRNIGAKVWIELSIRVAPRRRMAEVGAIRTLVRGEICASVERVANVMIEVIPAFAGEPADANSLMKCEAKQ